MFFKIEWRPLTLAALVLLISGLYLSTAYTAAPQRVVAPLDDAYITFQYARQIALGHPYQYNDGDLPTTGMTSPLYGFFLAAVYRLGFTGERLAAVAVSLGVVWLGLVAWLTYRLASAMGDGRLQGTGAWLAAVLVVLTGAFQWSSFNGMETIPLAVLGLAAVWAWHRQRWGWCALFAALAALTRPEGLFLAGLLWLVVAIPHGRARAWGALAAQSAAVVMGLLPSAVNWWLTGTASAAGLVGKSWLYNVPYHGRDIAHSVLLSLRDILLYQFGGWAAVGHGFLPPLLGLMAVVGWWQLARSRQWAWLLLSAGWVGLGTLSSATLITATWHVGRYQAPFVPVVVLAAGYGVAGLWAKRDRRPWLRIALYGLVAGWVTIAAVSTLTYWAVYNQATHTVATQQLVLADWMRQNLPATARVGVHDVGSLRYVGGRATYDLIGLTTAKATIPWRHGSGAVFELMENSPIRPDYFASYPDVFSLPYLAQTDLFAEKLFETNVPNFAIASAGPVQAVWRADWQLAHSGDAFYQPDVLARMPFWQPVGQLDMADLTAEAAYNLIWWQTIQRPGFPTELHQFNYRTLPERTVLDGGRLLTGGLAFDVPTPDTADLWLVARLHAQQAGGVQVQANGQDMGQWLYPEVAGQWLETTFRIPAAVLTHPTTRLTLTVLENEATLHYAPYYFWFFQGDGTPPPPIIPTPSTAAFGPDQAVRVRGWGLAERSYHAGEHLSLTLFWEAAVPTTSAAKLFVHLYDAQGAIVAQVDGWPAQGTRPPYSWPTAEIITDTRVLDLPPDLPAGQYRLGMGLYTPTERLPLWDGSLRQPADTLFLADVTIVAR